MAEVVRAVPVEALSEQLSVQRLSEALGLQAMRANVYTLAEGAMLRHLHREQEELYLVLDGTAEVEVDGVVHRVGEREALAVPPGAWRQVANVGLGPLTFFVVGAPPAVADVEVDRRGE